MSAIYLLGLGQLINLLIDLKFLADNQVILYKIDISNEYVNKLILSFVPLIE